MKMQCWQQWRQQAPPECWWKLSCPRYKQSKAPCITTCHPPLLDVVTAVRGMHASALLLIARMHHACSITCEALCDVVQHMQGYHSVLHWCCWHRLQAATLHCITLTYRACLLNSSYECCCFTLHASQCHACCSTSWFRSGTCSCHEAHLLTQCRRQLSLSYGVTRAAPIPLMSFILHQHCEWSAATMSPARGEA